MLKLTDLTDQTATPASSRKRVRMLRWIASSPGVVASNLAAMGIRRRSARLTTARVPQANYGSAWPSNSAASIWIIFPSSRMRSDVLHRRRALANQ